MSAAQTIPAANNASVLSFTIKIDGTAIPQSFNVVSAVVNKEANKIPWCCISILDGNAAGGDFPASNDALFVPGKELELWAGYSATEEILLKGIIIKHSIKIREHSNPVLNIEVKDKCVKLTEGLHSKYFTEKKDNEIIEEILDTYGIDKDVETTTAAIKELVQYYSTDWDFIVTRAEANGKLCFAENGKLVVKKPVTSASALDVVFGATILEFDAEIDARNQYKAVKSTAWDFANQSLLNVSGAEPSLPAVSNLSNSDLSSAIFNDDYLLQHGGIVAEDSLQGWADAALMKSRLAKVCGRVKFRGYSKVKPGDVIKLSGVGDRFNGDVYATGVRHELYKGAWSTDVQFGLSTKWFAKENDVTHLSAGGMLPGVKGLQIGIVTDLEDPISEFRVKVKIPAISNTEEGIWARMITPDAGKNRGIFFRPEIDDEVIIGFLHEDPNNPVVLGGVFSSAKTSPIAQTKDNDEKGLVTRSEMKWVWNDKKKALNIESPAGKKIIIDEDAGEINIADENGNKFIMNKDGISIESSKEIKIKAGTDLKMEGTNSELKASAGCTVKASGAMEVSSSATTTIKGSMVMIN
jgi:Rhs element Vgr protein